MGDIEDDHRIPDARDILGDRVNLRVLATRLLLSGHLVLRSDRAYPLNMQAPCPLPADRVMYGSQ